MYAPQQARATTLRPGSSTGIVILVLDGNDLLSYFQIQQLDTTWSKESVKIIELNITLIRLPMRMCNIKSSEDNIRSQF